MMLQTSKKEQQAMKITGKEKIKVLAGAKKVFYEALLDGYVGECKNSTKTKDLDGFTIITYVSGDYKIVDRYITSSYAGLSWGVTTIFYRGGIIWVMTYCGHYSKEVIPFLKEALRRTYSSKIFRGGRGPKHIYGEKLSYFNGYRGNFSNFSSHEYIEKRHSFKKMGFHNCEGGKLI
jgi:hypothetical protein